MVGQTSVDIRFAASAVPLMAFSAGFFVFSAGKIYDLAAGRFKKEISRRFS